MAALATLARARFLGIEVLNEPVDVVAAAIMVRKADVPFGYLVTPNADHIARLEAGDGTLAACYASAEARVFDSRFLARIASFVGVEVPQVVTGSDLTERLLTALPRETAIAVIGTTVEAVSTLRRAIGLSNLTHICLPFGFDPNSPAIVEHVVHALRSNPASLVLLACGSPRQEILARHLTQVRGLTGLGLCIGSAVDQVGGHTRRAPRYMRESGFEWVWRLITEPRRLLPRYIKSTRAVLAILSQKAAGTIDAAASTSKNV